MFNKKGISPIIATMLLVAFAVAIGASFVSYAGFYFEQKSSDKADCKNYLINFFELDKTKSFCAAQSSVPYAAKFEYTNKPVSKSGCYVSIASGTSRICDGKNLVGDTWIPSKGAEI